jgi:hypothetical protein
MHDSCCISFNSVLAGAHHVLQYHFIFCASHLKSLPLSMVSGQRNQCHLGAMRASRTSYPTHGTPSHQSLHIHQALPWCMHTEVWEARSRLQNPQYPGSLSASLIPLGWEFLTWRSRQFWVGVCRIFCICHVWVWTCAFHRKGSIVFIILLIEPWSSEDSSAGEPRGSQGEGCRT